MTELALLVAAVAAIVALATAARAAGLARRVTELERQLARSRAAHPGDGADAIARPVRAAPSPLVAADAPSPATEAPLGPTAPVVGPRPAPDEGPRGVEAAIGLTWATRVGGALLLAGVAYFFTYAVERDWLGPWARVGVGAGVGALTLAVAASLRGRASATWVDVLAGVALAILLVTAWASHALYALVEPAVAFVAIAAVIALGGALAARFDSEALLVTATLGGLANPVALAAAVDGPALHFATLVLVAAGTLALATPRRWPWATAAAALGGAALAGAWVAALPDRAALADPDRLIALAGVALFANALVLAGLRWPTGLVRAGLIGLAAAVVSLALALLAPATADHLVLGGLLVIAAALALLGARRDVAPAGLLALGAAAAAPLLRDLTADAPTLALIGLLTALYAVDAALALRRAPSGGGPVARGEALRWQLALAAFAVAALALEAVDATDRGGAVLADEREVLAVVAATMAGLYAALTWLLARPPSRDAGAAVAAAVALAFTVALAPLTLSGAPVVLAWSVAATAAAQVAARARLPRLDQAAVATLALAAAHLAWVDWPSVDLARALYLDSGGAAGALAPPSLLGDRGLALFGLGLGALGFAAAASIAPHAPRFARAGLAARFAGLGLLAAWAATEAALLVDRGAVAGTPADAALIATALGDAASLRAIAVTLTLGGFGALVLVWGFARRRVQLRWFGLGLLSLVVVKLVAVDLWGFDPVARTVILIAFGALLLASGFLYARFGARLRELLRDDARALTAAAHTGASTTSHDPPPKFLPDEGERS